jgi:uncharacterized membrane protein YbhN (UPF0104 family)
MSNQPHTPFKTYITRAIKSILVALILYYLFRRIASHWDDISSYKWQIRPLYLIASVLVGQVTFWLFSYIWRIIIAGFGHDIPPARAFKISYVSNMGRYIPGKLWQFFGMIYMTRKEGVPPEQAASSVVLIQLFAIPASFLVFVLCSQFEPRVLVDQVAVLGSYSALLMTVAMLAACAIMVMWPQKVLLLGNMLLKRIGREPVVFALDKRVALLILVGYCLAWIGYGLAYWLFLQAVMVNPTVGPIASIAIFNAAYQIGYLVLFAPGGFGPRELAMGALLTPFAGAALAPALAIIARLWAMLVEVTAAAIALMIRK